MLSHPPSILTHHVATVLKGQNKSQLAEATQKDMDTIGISSVCSDNIAKTGTSGAGRYRLL